MLLDLIGEWIFEVKRPVLVDVGDNADAAFAVGCAGAAFGTDVDVVSDAYGVSRSVDAGNYRGGKGQY